MLKITYENRDDYFNIMSKIKKDPRYKYWDLANYKIHSIEDPYSSDYNHIQRLVYNNKNECIGIVEATVDRGYNVVNNLSVFNLGNKFTFGKALIEFFDLIFMKYKFRKVYWECRADNPMVKMYEKYARLVGTMEQHYLLFEDGITDAKIFEITRDTYIERIIGDKYENN